MKNDYCFIFECLTFVAPVDTYSQCCQPSTSRRSETADMFISTCYVLHAIDKSLYACRVNSLFVHTSVFLFSRSLCIRLVDPAFLFYTPTPAIEMGRIQLFAVTILSLVAINWAALQIDSNVQNKNVECSIDLTTQLVKTQCKVTVENVAKKDLVGATYTFLLTVEQHKRLAFISVKDALKKELKTAEETVPEGVAFTVILNSASPTPVLNIETIFTKSLQPYPTQITQSERQFVRYFGNAYFYSPYKTLTQKTTVQLASKSVESYTTVKPSSQSDALITYGPYENVAGQYLPSEAILFVFARIELQIDSPLCSHHNRTDCHSLRKSNTILDRHQFGTGHRGVALGKHCHRRDHRHCAHGCRTQGIVLTLRFPKRCTWLTVLRQIVQNHFARISQRSLLQVHTCSNPILPS